MQAQRGSRSTAVRILNIGARKGWVVNAMPRPLYTRERDLLPNVQAAGWVAAPVFTGMEYLAATKY
jgi:hypothetical protein